MFTFVLEAAKLDNIETNQEDPVKGAHQANESMVERRENECRKGDSTTGLFTLGE